MVKTGSFILIIILSVLNIAWLFNGKGNHNHEILGSLTCGGISLLTPGAGPSLTYKYNNIFQSNFSTGMFFWYNSHNSKYVAIEEQEVIICPHVCWNNTIQIGAGIANNYGTTFFVPIEIIPISILFFDDNVKFTPITFCFAFETDRPNFDNKDFHFHFAWIKLLETGILF